MSREDPQMKIRLPEALKSRIEEASTTNNRSMNAEIVARLESSFNSGATDDNVAALTKTVDESLKQFQAATAELEAARARLEESRLEVESTAKQVAGIPLHDILEAINRIKSAN